MAAQLPPGLVVSVNRYDDPPPGLPDRCFVISNSERSTAICDRRYLLAVIEGLKASRHQAPARYGALYHGVKEHIYKAWLADRPPTPDEVNTGLYEAKTALKEDVGAGRLSAEDSLDIYARLESSIDAWLHLHGGGQPPKTFQLIAFENSLAMPVRTAAGRVYAPDMFLVEFKTGCWRIARAGERAQAVKVNWPWYFIGRLDMLFRHRSRGGIYVADDKTTKSPLSLLRSVTNDPQVPSYLALLRYNIDQGLLPGIAPKTPVLGFWHRITNSAGFRPPRVIKSRKKADNGRVVGLSLAKNQRCLSWKYRAGLVDLGLDPSLPAYADMIDYLRKNVDAHVEINESTDYPPEDLARFERELYADVRRVSALWRSALRAETVEDLDYTHRRVPICQVQNWPCRFVGPCMRDGKEARAGFDQKPWLTFRVRPEGAGATSDTPDAGAASTDTNNTNSNTTPADKLGW